MTKFADQLFGDLMREHGSTLAHAAPRAVQKRHVAARRAVLAGGAGCAAAGVIAGTLVAGGGSAAYAVTKNADGTVTLAVYKASGIAGANARLHELGDDQVVIVPVGPGCPTMRSLPAPPVPPHGHVSISQARNVKDGSITVDARGIPVGDILVVASETAANGSATTTMSGSRLTSAPAPSCVSMPAPPPPPGNG